MNVSAIVDRISQTLLGSPLAMHVERELDSERLAQRRALAAERAALDAQDLEAAQAALDAAHAHAAAVDQAALVASVAIEHRRSQIERALRDSASTPLIAACITRLDAWLAELDQAIQYKQTTDQRTDVVHTWTNYQSVMARMAAIRHARTAAGALAVEPLDDAELAARLAALQSAIPAIGSDRSERESRSGALCRYMSW